jgi:hypothetical protein
MDKITKLIQKPVFWVAMVVIILILGVLTLGIYQYSRMQSEISKLKQTPANGQLTDERQRELIAEVSSKISLPADEKPTVAVVSDINRLKEQQFFSAGQNGDVVLIYMNARKAILYRPQEKKIIEVAPVNLSNNQASVSAQTVAGAQTTTPAPTNGTSPSTTPAIPTGTFALRNGTTITGLARTFEGTLSSRYPSANVVERGNANKRDYAVSTLVDVKGTRGVEAAQIAQTLGIQAGPLPVGELTTSADFLIIIGADKR